MQGAQVLSLVRELRFHMLWGAGKKKKKFSNIPGFYLLDPLEAAMPFHSSYNSQNCFRTFPNVPHRESHPQARNLPEVISQTHHNGKVYLIYKPSFGSQQLSWMKDIVCGVCSDYLISIPPSYVFHDVGLKPSQYCNYPPIKIKIKK